MNKKIIFSFPGGRGTEIPLLYFAAKYYEDHNYEKVFINHPVPSADYDSLYENAKSILKSFDFREYDDVIFVAKSIGTVIACKLKEELNINASFILFTPIEDTLPFIKKANRIILIAASNNDRYLDNKTLCEHCEKEQVTYYIEPNVGHRMEVRDDLNKNLQVIKNIIGRLEALTNYVSI